VNDKRKDKEVSVKNVSNNEAQKSGYEIKVNGTL
jgi:hypothetical protein